MFIDIQEFSNKGLQYTIRSAMEKDAGELSELRVKIDGETENLDREPGEAFIDVKGFEHVIRTDTEQSTNLFLVAVVRERIVGFLRCEGSQLKRFSHKVELGICILQEFWGYGIGKNLLNQAISWADENDIRKITLYVLETNEKAIQLYRRLGFEIEGVLKQDRLLSDGNYYSTVVMGRFNFGNEK